ncbi:hypothetical protein FJV76_27365 [Mesorhizobium sp. WSM4303]|uniref:hypothetical protein n=1 Tax=unclassified Mesorhizobium TaxID=325217 RepID=UPI00115D2D2F|nr:MULTISPECIES: hypothetical protein [unclassified Mesorhizobium]TRC97352.1 hypothetical protein FJV76_27365 [Mesorhizobium sp. WSM4303]TRC99004.1 hypothetical protein FJV77_06960 [Mesorhizobium sp. WSM4306]
MASESDRVARAGDYVLGLMNDRARARAERDLAIDPAFRDTVMRLAERMHVFDRAEPSGGSDRWRLISQRIAEMPQMRPVAAGEAKPKPVIHNLERRPYGVGVHTLGGRRGAVIAIVLIVVFALGYLAGLLSAGNALLP